MNSSTIEFVSLMNRRWFYLHSLKTQHDSYAEKYEDKEASAEKWILQSAPFQSYLHEFFGLKINGVVSFTVHVKTDL